MGGINCKPGNTNNIPRKLLSAYSNAGAKYAHDLFKAGAEFSLANVGIETHIISNEKAISLEVVRQLNLAISHLTLAADRLQKVAPLWAEITTEVFVDFDLQKSQLQKSSNELQRSVRLIEEVNLIAPIVGLQQALWKVDPISNTATSIAKCMEWQYHFCKCGADCVLQLQDAA